MIWLAAGPLEPDLADKGLLLPRPGTHAEFPQRFSWTAVPGADVYEISVTDRASGELLFRQAGETTVLDLHFEPTQAPPPGSYAWEVRAFRGAEMLGAAASAFVVAGP